MANVYEWIMGRREFLSEEEVLGWVQRAGQFDAKEESTEDARLMLLFETRQQHTWLVRTERRIYNILDDIRKPEPHLNWVMELEDILKEGDLELPIQVRETRTGSARAGLVDFGPRHKNWYYSKPLFKKEPKPVIESFLKGTLMDP